MENRLLKLRSTRQKTGDGQGDKPLDYRKYLDPLRALRLVFAALVFALSFLELLPAGARTAMVLMAAVLCAFDLVLDIWEGFGGKRLPLSQLLLLAAAVAAMFGSLKSGAAALILYRLGSLFIAWLLPLAQSSVHSLFDLLPETVCQLEPDGTTREVSPDSLTVGDMIVLRPGDLAAVDCVVFEGSSAVDYSALAGDDTPRPTGAEDVIFSGAVNLAAPLKAEVTAPADASTAARVRRMTLREGEGRSETEALADKLSALFVPAVVILALLLSGALPFALKLSHGEAIARAAVFLAVASTLGIELSVPLAYFAGRGRSAAMGVLFRNASAIDRASDAAAVVFDKTGTLSTGEFKVVSIRSDKMSAETMLKLAAHAESHSSHPIAKAIINAYSGQIYIELVQNVREVPGQGITADIGKVQIVVGSRDFLMRNHVVVTDDATENVEVCISVGGMYAGRILLSDSVRDSALFAVELLKECVGESVYMLTGDREDASRKIAAAIGIEKYFSACGPKQKAAHLDAIREGLSPGGNLLYVSSGISGREEIPAAGPDLRVVMGALHIPFDNSDAHIVLLDDDPTKVASAISASRSIRRTIFTNMAAVLAAKAAVLCLAALGAMPIWLAVLLDYLVATAVILNAVSSYSLKDSSSRWGRKRA